MIIERPEADKINKIRKWVLVYGRRKTGKTFLVREFVKYDEYFFVKRNRTILDKDNNEITVKTLKEIIKRTLGQKTIVIDEFHRLGEDFLDFLHYLNGKGKLILISSTLWLARKFFEKNSPLLGLIAEFPIGLIELTDTLKKIKTIAVKDKKTIVELAVLAREPIILPFIENKVELAEIILYYKNAIPALVGEIFKEEEKELSPIYEGILRAVATGKRISSEISSALFARELIQKDDPSIIQQYLSNLVKFGILKKIRIYGKKNRFVYEHTSPLFWLYFYADEKYNIGERKLSSKEITLIINEVMPKIIESTIRGWLAKIYGLQEAIGEIKGKDIDICLLRFKKPYLAAEVKWKKNINKTDIKKAEANLDVIQTNYKYIIIPNKTEKLKSKYKIVDCFDLL